MTITETYQVPAQWGTLAAPLQKILSSQNGVSGSGMDRLHAIGQRQFATLPFPDRKNEDWKYTPLRELFNTHFAVAEPQPDVFSRLRSIAPMPDAIRLVFVNGVFTPGISDPVPAGVWIGTIQEAITEPARAQKLHRIADELETTQMTPFEALVTGSVETGMCLFIEKDVALHTPLHCIYLSTAGNAPHFAFQYKCIIAAENSSAHLVEHFEGDADQYFINTVSHLHVARGAHLKHYRMQHESAGAFHIAATRVFQEQDSEFTSLSVEVGGKIVRHNIEAIHLGTGITSNIYGVFKGNDRQHIDTQSFIDHAHPHCVSNELYKGVLDGYARGVFNGKIIVRPDAQKTNAFQQNSTLLLSPNAIMDSKPQLEIFADDVRCSHGATIGQLSEDAMFYLRTRGLTTSQASAMLQRAFIGEVLDHCAHEGIRAYFDHHLENNA